jgi:hypothetical protein
MRKGVPEFAAGVAPLKAAGQDHGQSGAGDDAELAEAGYGAGKPPAGNSDPHAALDYDGV